MDVKRRDLLGTAFVLVFITSWLSSAGCAPVSKNGSAVENVEGLTATLTNIQVFFKLDPRLTQGLYMGERWVSPPTYEIVVAEGAPYTVEARVEILDNNGQSLLVDAEWIVEDPEMVTVTPGQDNAVMINIQRDGETTLQVATQDATKTLSIKAVYQDKALHVQVSQVDG